MTVRSLWRGHPAVLAAGIAALVTVLFLFSLSSGWASRLENLYHDAWHRFAGKRFEPQHVALVMIDDATLARHADTPLAFWTPHFAKAIETLRAVGARLIVLDFIFSGSPEQWLSQLGVSDLDSARNHDRPFRTAISQGDVILAGFMVGEGSEAGDFTLPTPDLLLSLPQQDVAGHVGLANLLLDADSVVRHYRIRQSITETMQAEGLPDHTLAGLAVKKIAAESLPDDRVRPITYAGPPGSFPFISFARLLEVDAANDPVLRVLAGKLVIVGTGYAGMNDVHPTPYSNTIGASDQLMSGPEIQANIAETLLSGREMRAAPHYAEALVLFLGAWLCAYLVLSHGFSVAAGAYLIFVALVTYGAFRIFTEAILVDAFQMQALPIVALALAGVGKFGRTERERKRLNALFGRYVSGRVMEALLASPDMPALGGARREITVLFSDIRGFTTLSELLAPEEVVELLNEYFQRICAALLAEEATIDKFIGDAVMAEFGAPLAQHDHADRALRAAVALQRTAQEFADWVQTHFPDRQLPPFAIGIGLHTGAAVVGNIGSQWRMEYTAVGDTVNTASRLEGMTKTVGCPILVSRATYEAAQQRGEMKFGAWHSLSVKGRSQEVEAVELWP